MDNATIHHKKETAVDVAIQSIREAIEDENTEICLVIANTETGNLRVICLNMPEEEVPMLLTAAAEEVAEAIIEMYENRTVN